MQYPKHYLYQVVFQANFNTIPSLKTHLDSEIKGLIFDITDQQPTEQKNSQISINVGGNAPVITELLSQWVAIGNDIQIVLQSGLLQIINLKYSDYNRFHDIIERIFMKLKAIHSDITITRIAIRYINRINLLNGSTFDFDGLINNNLLNATTYFKNEGLARSLGSMVINYPDEDLTVNFTYGYYNLEFPSRIIKRDFLLDYDCATSHIVLSDPIESLKPILVKIRNKVNHLFNISIEQGLKDLMQNI